MKQMFSVEDYLIEKNTILKVIDKLFIIVHSQVCCVLTVQCAEDGFHYYTHKYIFFSFWTKAMSHVMFFFLGSKPSKSYSVSCFGCLFVFFLVRLWRFFKGSAACFFLVAFLRQRCSVSDFVNKISSQLHI